jgi:hypothetical protein
MLSNPAKTAFPAYSQDRLQQFRVQVRRHRVEQLRHLLSQPVAINPQPFDRDVWAFENDCLLDGQSIKHEIFGYVADRIFKRPFGATSSPAGGPAGAASSQVERGAEQLSLVLDRRRRLW